MHKGWSKRLLAVLLSLSMVCGSSIIPATTTYAQEIAYEGEETTEEVVESEEQAEEESVTDEADKQDEYDGQEDGTEQESGEKQLGELADSVIVAVEALDQTEYVFAEKPSLEEVMMKLPQSLGVTFEDDTTLKLPITWECLSDFEAIQDQYVFSVVIDNYKLVEDIRLPQVLVTIEGEIIEADGGALKELNFVERAKRNRVYQKPSGCSMASIACLENYVANERKYSFDDIVRINNNPESAYFAYWYKFGNLINEIREIKDKDDYSYLYSKMVQTNCPIIVKRSLGNQKTNIHYSLVVGYSDKNGDGIANKNEFVVMEVSESKSSTPEYKKFNDGANVPLDVWSIQDYCSGSLYQLVYYKGHVEDDAPTEPDDKNTPSTLGIQSIKKPEGTLTCGDTFSVEGTISSNYTIKSVKAYIQEESTKQHKYSKTVSPNSKYYYFGKSSEIDNEMKFASLPEGSYIYHLEATDSSGRTVSDESHFTKKQKQNEVKIEKASLSLNDSKNFIDETSATRTAILKNPGKKKITEAGMLLYDEYMNLIGKVEEPINSYATEMYLYYATSKYTTASIGKDLIPGTNYNYKIYAIVGNERYEVTGYFKTKGSAKPETPQPKVIYTEYSVNDPITVTWNEVKYAINGYRATLSSTDGSYVKEVETNTLEANFIAPSGGEYEISVVARGYQESDPGVVAQKITVHPNHKVTFIEVDDEGNEIVLKEEMVKHGYAAKAPTLNARQGFAFTGWDKSYYKVTEDIKLYAQYTRNLYKVDFVDPYGKVLSSEYIAYEGEATPPEDPDPSEDGYIFTGWDTNEYLCVKGNLQVTATYVYKNADLPIQLTVDSCAYDSDGVGYTVRYSMKNYDQANTSGRAIASLMTEDGRLVFSTESNAFVLKKNEDKRNAEIFIPYEKNAAYVEVVIMNSFQKSIPLSEKKSATVTRSWSSWDTVNPGKEEQEERTVYRYRDLQFDTRNESVYPGWNQIGYEDYWGPYGDWSEWSRNPYYKSDSRDIETRNVVDRYGYREKQYYFYKYMKNNGWMYSYADRTGMSGTSRHEYHDIWINESGDSRRMVYNGLDDGHEKYVCEPYQFYKIEYFYPGTTRTTPDTTHTEWRCRDRSLLRRFKYQRWSDWSDWSTQEVTASSTREVESVKQYRYKTTAVQTEEWTGETYHVSGTLGENLADKQVMLVVYKGHDVADYTIEYVGQGKTDEEGKYEFSFFTREIPSEITGDFTIKLGIEGAEELLYIDTIKAPKPVYKVTFVDWDGTVLDEQEVKEGESAKLPTEPTRSGYRFIGWNTGLSNVHDNLNILASYEKEQCTVVFVDWSQKKVTREVYDVGADLVYPSWKDMEGYQFKGWFDDNGNSVTKASQNLILTARYDHEEYTVKFYDQNNEVLQESIVTYGSNVIPPEEPEIEGLRFASWSNYKYTNVKEDLNIYPSFEYYETTKKPEASLKSCTLSQNTTVTLSCAEEGASILYTVDGSNPDMFSKEYTEPISITKNTVLKFFSRSLDKNDSEVVTEAYIMTGSEDDAGALTIKKDKLNLVVGEEAPQITYFLYHENASIGVEFYSLDDSVVSVNNEGQLFINNVGTTQVFAVTTDARYADSCEITVTSNEVPMDTMELSENKLVLCTGDEQDLQTKITPDNATYQDVLWSSEDDNVVTINQEGHLVAEEEGSTYIKAVSHDGDNVAYCFVTVNSSVLTISHQELVLGVGQSQQLTAEVRGVAHSYTWKSSDERIATVDSNGLVSANTPGTAIILVTADNGDFRACTLRVTNGSKMADPPAAPTVKKVSSSEIELNLQDGCEYSLDCSNWYSNPVFKGLQSDTIYTAYSRVKETPEALASPASEGTVIRTEADDLYIRDIEDQEYTGKQIKPQVLVYYGSQLLKEKTDYKVTYKNNIAVSNTNPKVVITGMGVYTGVIEKSFAIVNKNLTSPDVIIEDMAMNITGRVQQPVPKITANGKVLKKDVDFTVDYPDQDAGAYKEEGNWNVVITGKGNYTGTVTTTALITNKQLLQKAKISKQATLTYNGKVQKASVTVKLGSTILKETVDYQIDYFDTTEGAYCNPGTWNVKVTGIGKYAGSKLFSMKIQGIDLKKAVVDGIENAFYSGHEVTQDKVEVSLNGNKLRQGIDYKVACANNKNVGNARVDIIGMGGYVGTVHKSFKILKYDIQTDEESLFSFDNLNDAYPYVASGTKPSPNVYFNGELLTENVDYSLKYANNKTLNDGTDAKKIPTVTIVGKNNIYGSITREFIIVQQDLSNLTMEADDIVYKNKVKAYMAKPVLYGSDGKKLTINKDFDKNLKYTYVDGSEIAADEIPEIGTEIMVTAQGVGNYIGTASCTYRIAEKSINRTKVNKVTKAYKGTAIELELNELVVTDGNATLVENVDYVIVSDTYKSNVKPGTASVVIRGIGKYFGTKKVQFVISKKTWSKK